MKNAIHLFFLFTLLIITSSTFSQTPGLIFEPAGSSAGKLVLDPNSDGYISETINGFITSDRDESEIPFIPLIFPGSEPGSDINAGPSCGFTDFVESTDNDPAQNYFDASGNWIFRLRMANVSSNAKSYSIFIDANQLFGPSDPNYTSSNPGFEMEIVLATKFGVSVYDHRASNPTPCIPIINYPGADNYQKAIALSTVCGSTNYFLDFFVDLADITTIFGYDKTTVFRSAISSNLAANKSSICSQATSSDLGGVPADCGSFESCLTTIIENQAPCPPEDINTGNCLSISATPIITGPINTGSTSISGTSIEGDGTIIEIFVDGISVGTTSVTAGSWSISDLTTLTSGQVITAKSTAPSKAESSISNSVTVGATCTADILTATDCGKGISGTSGVVGATIRVYPNNSTTTWTPTAGSTWNTGGTITVTASGTFLWKRNSQTGEQTGCTSGGGNLITDGSYRITQQSGSQCESQGVWVCVGSSVTTSIPTITTSPISTATTSISGTVPSPDNIAGITVFVYINGLNVTQVTSTVGGSWTASGLSLNGCDVITVQALNNTKCISAVSSDYNVIGSQSSAPSISGDYCTATNITSVSGTSTENDGTQIQVYNNGVTTGTPATVTNSAWTASPISIPAGNTITAKATAPCKSQSVASAGVVVNVKNTNIPVITTVTVTEGDTNITGTGTNGDIISLFIDDYPIYTDLAETTLATTTVTGGIWTINTIYSSALYAGGELTAKASTGASCSSNASNIKIVQCLPPATNKTIEAIEADYCQTIEDGQIKITNSDRNIIYTPVLNDAGNTVFGYSSLGNGNDLILRTYGIDAVPLDVTVSAMKIGGTVCEGINTNTDSFNTLYLIPETKTVTSSKYEICDKEAVDITIQATEPSIRYRLLESGTSNYLGSTIVGDGNDQDINTGEISNEMDIEVIASIYYSIPNKTCETTFANKISITADPACGIILPIELLYFQPECGSVSGVIINWATSSEKNNDYFTLYRSLDGKNWIDIQTILGAGNSNTIINYSITDIEPMTHDTYYKLAQTDFDGNSKEFDIVAIYCKFDHKKIQLFPVPTDAILNLTFYNEHHTIDLLTVNIFDMSGHLIKSELFTSEAEQNDFVLNVSDLKSGNYFIQVMLGSDYFYTNPFIISR